MATNIRRRGKSYVVHFRRDGEQHWRSFKTKGEAELYLANAKLRKAQGQPEPSTRPVELTEAAERWLKHKRGRVGDWTYVNYESVLRVHILPTLGSLDVRHVGRETLDGFVTDWINGGPLFEARVALARAREAERAREQLRDPRRIRIGRSPKTISNAIVVLCAMFEQFRLWNYIVVSPAVRLERPRDDRTTESTMHALDAAGMRALVDSAEGLFAKTLLLTAAMTGVRRGELLALRWKDIDYTNGRMWVRGSVGLGGKITKPKTKRSTRAIALPTTLSNELERHWRESKFRADDDFIFASDRGTPLDGRNMIRTVFEPARKRAGLNGLRFHDLRHSYTSVLVAQGVPPKVISDALGHASIQITMDRYAHLFDSASADVSRELEKAWAADQTASTLQADRVQSDAAAFHDNGARSDELPANVTV